MCTETVGPSGPLSNAAAEAECYRDHLGDRLYRPEQVPKNQRHLIPDDLQRVKRLLEFPVQGRVLEVGCSDGTLLREVYRRWPVKKATGVDVAASAIAEAQQGQETPDTFQWIHADFLDWGGTIDDRFEAIYACEFLEHLWDWQLDRALGHLARLLTPGGVLIVSVPNACPDARYVKEGRARWNWPSHHLLFDRFLLNARLKPFFTELDWRPLYRDEFVHESIYLIVRAMTSR